MRAFSISGWVLVSAVLLTLPGAAQAQSWKPVCVNGGTSGGAHNNTWQRVNTSGTGGGTWKKAGGCVATPPPNPPPDPAGPPPDVFNGRAILKDFWGYTPDWGVAEGWVKLDLAPAGSWSGTGGPNFQSERGPGNQAGNWRAAGYAGSDFEVMWVITKTQTSVLTYEELDGVSFKLTSSTAPGTWSSMENGWQIRLGAWDGGCYLYGADVIVWFDLYIRSKKDPSIQRKDTIDLAAHGYNGSFCGG